MGMHKFFCDYMFSLPSNISGKPALLALNVASLDINLLRMEFDRIMVEYEPIYLYLEIKEPSQIVTYYPAYIIGSSEKHGLVYRLLTIQLEVIHMRDIT